MTPVSFYLPHPDESIERVRLASLLERKNATHKRKENDSCREQICFTAVMSLTLFYFRRHIRFGSEKGLELVNILVCTETKIGKF